MLKATTFAAIATLTLAAPASAQLRPMVYTETTVERSADEVFADWTTDASVEAFFAPKANIKPVPGGRYRLCFAPGAPEGSCGNDEGRVMAVQPGRMLSFSWAMPPYMAEIRPHMTSVQILFEPLGDERTRVRLFHTGFGEGEAWAEGRNYFAKTWPTVLENYRAFTAD